MYAAPNRAVGMEGSETRRHGGRRLGPHEAGSDRTRGQGVVGRDAVARARIKTGAVREKKKGVAVSVRGVQEETEGRVVRMKGKM